MDYYSAIKKNEILPFANMWMELEGIMLSEISQRKTNIIGLHSCEDFETLFTPDSFPVMDSEGQSNLNVLVMETFYFITFIFYFFNFIFLNLHPN